MDARRDESLDESRQHPTSVDHEQTHRDLLYGSYGLQMAFRIESDRGWSDQIELLETVAKLVAGDAEQLRSPCLVVS